MSGAMLPITSADAGSGVPRNGRTAAGWLPVNGTSEPDEGGEVGHGEAEAAVADLARADEVTEELEADRSVERAPRQQRAAPYRLVERGMVPTEDGDRVVADQSGIARAVSLRERSRPRRVAEDASENDPDAGGRRHG